MHGKKAYPYSTSGLVSGGWGRHASAALFLGQGLVPHCTLCGVGLRAFCDESGKFRPRSGSNL